MPRKMAARRSNSCAENARFETALQVRLVQRCQSDSVNEARGNCDV